MKYAVGTMHYDYEQDRYMITFDNDNREISQKYPVLLHCGNCFDVFSSGQWIETRIEMNRQGQWYLIDTQIPPNSMDGFRVRCFVV